MVPAVDESLGRLAGAKIFSKLDACSGYYQIGLDKKSRKLTTFITPFGRFCFNRLSMGLSSSGEHFQKQMSIILEGTEGVCNLMDDILIFGATEAEHDERLEIVLRRLRDNKGATPLETGFSPAELMMRRKVRSNNPISGEKLQPKWTWLKEHHDKLEEKRNRDKRVFDRRHRVRELGELEPGQRVWIRDRKKYGTVLSRRGEPRSYKVETTAGVIRRNRAFLVSTQKIGEDTDYE